MMPSLPLPLRETPAPAAEDPAGHSRGRRTPAHCGRVPKTDAAAARSGQGHTLLQFSPCRPTHSLSGRPIAPCPAACQCRLSRPVSSSTSTRTREKPRCRRVPPQLQPTSRQRFVRWCRCSYGPRLPLAMPCEWAPLWGRFGHGLVSGLGFDRHDEWASKGAAHKKTPAGRGSLAVCRRRHSSSATRRLRSCQSAMNATHTVASV